MAFSIEWASLCNIYFYCARINASVGSWLRYVRQVCSRAHRPFADQAKSSAMESMADVEKFIGILGISSAYIFNIFKMPS